MYHSFFAKKIENSSSLKKGAWVVASVVAGIFAYPMFGALAGIGILVKLTGTSGVKKHNQSEKNTIESIRFGVKCSGGSESGGFEDEVSQSISQSGWQMSVVREFTITKQNADALSRTINQEIDSFSNQFKKIYIASNGYINRDGGQITVQLRVRERV
jgi:hypothetical protein